MDLSCLCEISFLFVPSFRPSRCYFSEDSDQFIVIPCVVPYAFLSEDQERCAHIYLWTTPSNCCGNHRCRRTRRRVWLKGTMYTYTLLSSNDDYLGHFKKNYDWLIDWLIDRSYTCPFRLWHCCHHHLRLPWLQ